MANSMVVSQKIKQELPYNSEIPLNIFKRMKAGTGTDCCTSRFIAALFTIAKRQKLHKCPLTDE